MNGWLRYNVRCSADVAQSVEHLIGNEEVGSSNLLISSKNRQSSTPKRVLFFCFPADGKCENLLISSTCFGGDKVIMLASSLRADGIRPYKERAF